LEEMALGSLVSQLERVSVSGIFTIAMPYLQNIKVFKTSKNKTNKQTKPKQQQQKNPKTKSPYSSTR